MANPIATDDTVVIQPVTTLIVDPIQTNNGNGVDSDPDGDPISLLSLEDRENPGVPIPFVALQTVVLISGTEITFGASATDPLTIVQPKYADGTEVFNYTIGDGTGATDTGSVTLQTDSDGDGIANVDDIDDDNDGITDINEAGFDPTQQITLPTGTLGVADDFSGTNLTFQVINSTAFGLGQLFALDPAAASYIPIGTNSGFTYNAIGYDTDTDFIFGLARSAGVDALGAAVVPTDLIKIDANGETFLVGKTNVSSVAGDVMDGHLVVQSGNKAYKIDLATAAATELTGAISAAVDYSLIGGVLYGIKESLLQKVTVNLVDNTASETTTVITDPNGGAVAISSGAVWGATNANGDQELYAFDNATGEIFLINDFTTANPTATYIGTTISSGNNDGARNLLTEFVPPLPDMDADGAPDHLDIDKDNDGIADNIEAQSTAGYIAPSGIDADNDGLDDAYDKAIGDTDPVASAGLVQVDTDGDTIVDAVDSDSDNDGTLDVAERDDGQPTALGGLADTDGDGLLDDFEGADTDDGYDVNDENILGDNGGLDGDYTNFNLGDADDDTDADDPVPGRTGNDAIALNTDLDWRDNTRPPIATDDEALIQPGTGKVLDLIGSDNGSGIDSDPDGDTLEIVEIEDPANPGVAIPFASGATVTLASGTTLTFGATAHDPVTVEQPHYSDGTETFSYTISDGKGGRDSATVTLLTDTDGDGVANSDDLDDDNDGVLDTEEGYCPGSDDIAFDPTTGALTNIIGGDTALSSATEYVIASGGDPEPNGLPYINGYDKAGGFGGFDYEFDFPITQTAAEQVVLSVNYYNAVAGGVDEAANDGTGLANYPNLLPAGNNTSYGGNFDVTLKTDQGNLPTTVTLSLAQLTALQQGHWVPLDIVIDVPSPGPLQIIGFTFALEGILAGFTPGGFDPVNSEVFALSISNITLPEKSVDSDGDGAADHLDIDSDNDGVTDNVEAQSTAGYRATSGIDADNDGLDDAYDANTGASNGSLGLTPVDTDSDGTADLLDDDSDNDGDPDIAERGDGQATTTPGALDDADGDGLLDVFEGADSNDGFDVNDENISGDNGGADGDYTNFNIGDQDTDTDADDASAGRTSNDAVAMLSDLDWRDDKQMSEDVFFYGVPCDPNDLPDFDTKWTVYNGSEKLRLEVKIPIETIFGPDSTYIFDSVDVSAYETVFANLGATGFSKEKVKVKNKEITIQLVAKDMPLTPAEIAALPDEIDTQITVVDVYGNTRTVDVCVGVHETKVNTPIVLDLNGDGEIGVTGPSTAKVRVDDALGDAVWFDIDGDASLDRIEWLSGDGDGLLVDNRDGRASHDMNGTRLFGDDGGTYANGYDKLATLDTNNDGKLSGAELDGLALWVDDGNALVEGGEMHAVTDHGIDSILVTSATVVNDAGEDLIRSSFDFGSSGQLSPNTDGIDLLVARLDLASDTLQTGDDLIVNLDVANIGNEDASKVRSHIYWSATDTFDITTAVKLAEDGHGQLHAGELDGNERVKINYADIAPLGDGFIFAKIDATDRHDELDEGNNVSQAVAVNITGGPYQSDLRLSEMRVLDSSLEDGQSLKIKFDAINSGDINARSVETTLYWSTDNSFDADLDTILQTDAHGTLSAGETDLNERFVVSYDDLEHLGNGYLFAKIDASGEHRESDENNNVTAAVALELVGDTEDADVRMISLSVSQDTIDEGDRIKVFATVDNDGTTEAEEVETFVYWSLDNTLDDQADSLLGVINHQDLKAGEVEIDDLRLTYGDLAPLGDGFLIALAISEGTDTDLGNNTSVALEIDIL
jgi:hypothetical protein